MFFKKNTANRKTTKRPRLYRMRRAVLDWILFAGNTVLIVGAITGSYYFLATSSVFKLKEVELSGSFRHTTQKGVEKLAEAPLGKNLFTINLNRLEENVRRHPWIKRVEVRRQLPGKIRIHVEEYEPMAIIRAGDDYLMSFEGKIFKKLRAGEAPDLPVISGFDPEKLGKYPSYYRAHVEEAFSFLNRLLARPLAGFGVKEIHYSVTEGITLTTAKNSTEIYFGQGDYEQKLDRWQEFAAAQGGGDTLYKRIDLHVEGKIFAQGETHGP